MAVVEPVSGWRCLRVLEAMEGAWPRARAECIDGVFTLNGPTPLHQSTAAQLLIALDPRIPAGHRVLTEVRVKDHDGQSWITPDILVVPQAVALSDKNPLDPDDIVMMCEVLSPSTERKDRTEKRAFAVGHGIDFWLVSPGARGERLRSCPTAAEPSPHHRHQTPSGSDDTGITLLT